MKKIAVLLAVYNGESWLTEQIDSVLRQKDVDVSLFISVDLSDDKSFELCSNLSRLDHRVTVLPYGERFGGAGKNFFRLMLDVEISEFDYISFADQDDIWFEDKLSRACKFLRNYDAYSSNVIAFWTTGKEILIDKAQNQVEFDYLFESAGPGCTFVFNKKCGNLFKNFLRENYSKTQNIALHDWLLYAFARANDLSWFIDSRPSMYYRQHENNQVGANNSFKAIIKRLILIRSHWYSNEINKIVELLPWVDIPFRENLKSKEYFSRLKVIWYIKNIRRKTIDRFFLSVVILLGFF
ncbi:glycosyltransferase [Hafnia paralvei]|uniref:Glycosyltransferase family 2 n=1 Tax=Hafnia alvei TaxID=569 RepID=A0A172WZW7_HAFAL|nr:glycosyltransferase [Hafnia paralvei]ANF29916.1 glycosyltransferase family 2 [Hafnia alvei]